MATVIDFEERRTVRAGERAWNGLVETLDELAAQAQTPPAFAVGDRVQLRSGAQRPDWYDAARERGEVWGEVGPTPYGNRRAVGLPVFNVIWHRWIPTLDACGGCERFAAGASRRACSYHNRWSTELAWYMCQGDLEPFSPAVAASPEK